jgi:hypothetical protein
LIVAPSELDVYEVASFALKQRVGGTWLLWTIFLTVISFLVQLAVPVLVIIYAVTGGYRQLGDTLLRQWGTMGDIGHAAPPTRCLPQSGTQRQATHDVLRM